MIILHVQYSIVRFLNFVLKNKKRNVLCHWYILPYNGIFSRRQISAVLSQKHDDYFLRILIFAVGNVREKIISVLFRENDRGGDITRLSLDRSTVRKENLRPKYLKRKGIKDTCSLADTKKNKQKEHINIQMVD